MSIELTPYAIFTQRLFNEGYCIPEIEIIDPRFAEQDEFYLEGESPLNFDQEC